MNIFRLACLTLGFAIAAPACQASVEISTDATKNMTCSDGVCSPTDKKAVLNVNDLTNMLAAGDVKITTGADAVTITVMSPFSWTSSHRLTLDAYYNVSFRAPVAVAGTGAVTITYNDGGSGGDLIFFPASKLDFWDTSSSLIINGKSYALVKDIATLAKSDATGRLALANDYDASVDGTYTSSPVTAMFVGTFEGLGHVISNLSIGGVGGALFANTSGTLRDLGITNLSINGTIIGAALVATDYGVTIIGCYASGAIVAGGAAGGLIASTREQGIRSIISRSHADISLTVSSMYGEAGGLVGASSSSITDSYATGSVTGGDNATLGGLIGTLFYPGTISQSFANVAVTSGRSSTIGGFIGSDSSEDQIINSYSTGMVKSGPLSKIGGFGGELGGTVDYTYSIGDVEARHAGGFVGEFDLYARPYRNYWDINTSGTKHCQGEDYCGRTAAKGYSTKRFMSGLPQKFDSAIWALSPSINNGYPYLLANPPQ
jgi:hypothetical protein